MKTKRTVLFMGYTCNNCCSFCCNLERKNFVKDESTSEIKNKILNAKKEGSDYLELIGGEPTIRNDILSLVKFAKKLEFNTIMFATNGRMFSYKDFAEKIIEAGVNHLVFSIHGHNTEIHDKLTQVPGSFNQLLKGLENLKKIGFTNIGSNTTIVKQNYKYLEEIGKFIYGQGIRNGEFIFVDPMRGGPKENFDEIVPTYSEVSHYIDKLLAFGKEKQIPHWHIRYYIPCFIDSKYHDMISEINEKKNFKTEHLAPDFSNKNVEKSRSIVGRTKIKECEMCKYSDVCEGPWKEYIKRRGSEEIKKAINAMQ